MRSPSEVYALFQSRRAGRGELLERMRLLADQVNGDIIVPLPELTSGEKPAVANLIAQGLDALAQRVSGTLPDIQYPVVRPGIQRSIDTAARKRQANLGWWSGSNMGLQLRKRTRLFLGYGCAPAQIVPDFTTGTPRWMVRNPLSAFPAPPRWEGDMTPSDCIFGYQKTASELAANYGLPTGRWPADKMFEVIEYVDSEQTIVIVVGPGMGVDEAEIFSGLGKQVIPLDGGSLYKMGTGDIQRRRGTCLVVAEQYPNRSDMCPVVVPGRITLDKVQGHFDSMLGMYSQQARLQALELLAVEQSVFPNEWVFDGPAGDAEIISIADGRAGQIGQIKGGQIVTTQLQPSTAATSMIDRLERYQRINGGVSPDTNGESSTNIRTGRRGDQILSATIDPTIQESQEIFAVALAEENKRAIAISKGYFGPRKTTFYVNWKGAKGQADYTPDDLFGDPGAENNIVSYSSAGSDVNSLIVGIGQRIGLGTMSKRGGAELDPLIDDPDVEHRQIIVEQLEQAALTSITQGAASGQLPLADLAAISKYVLTDLLPLYEAVQRANEDAQKRQATSGPPDSETGPVSDPNAPAAQPGLSAGQPVDAAQPAIQPPTQASANLSDLLTSLHRPQTAAAASVPA